MTLVSTLIDLVRPSFPHTQQRHAMDCGVACLETVARRFGRRLRRQEVEAVLSRSRQGISLFSLSKGAEAIGMHPRAVFCDYQDLLKLKNFPVIVHLHQNHYVVVHAATKRSVVLSDPGADGIIRSKRSDFERDWLTEQEDGQPLGVAMFFDVGPSFWDNAGTDEHRSLLLKLLPSLTPYRKIIAQLALTVLASSAITFLIPFVTQNLVDGAIQFQDFDLVTVLLIAQLTMFFALGIGVFFRRWILVYLSARINLALISGFMMRLLKLPISYFDRRNFGDLVSRLNDHGRVELFLNSNAFDIVFLGMMIVLYGAILAAYSGAILVSYIVGVAVFALWVRAFTKSRRNIDFRKFKALAQSRQQEVQLLAAVQELRISNSEAAFRLDWENTRSDLYHLSIASMKVEQWQSVGATFIIHIMLVVASFMAAFAVMQGTMTLGMMMATILILGQVSGPLLQSLEFLKLAQDATLSLERIQDVYETPTEEECGLGTGTNVSVAGDIVMEGVSFSYDGPDGMPVLSDLSLRIEEGKTTAIVGESGSGKTTLLKLLLRLYDPTAGDITLGGQPLNQVEVASWRDTCGVVMQEGYIFCETILRNVALSNNNVDMARLDWALEMSCAKPFVSQLPYGVMTKIGGDGLSLSVGQKQRLLIARALYKEPAFFFFDEATSALDAENEKRVVQNLDRVLNDKTRVVIAHRLSTVKNADKIVVLERGRIIEEGSHGELVRLRGRYFDLVSEQLELAK